MVSGIIQFICKQRCLIYFYTIPKIGKVGFLFFFLSWTSSLSFTMSSSCFQLPKNLLQRNTGRQDSIIHIRHNGQHYRFLGTTEKINIDRSDLFFIIDLKGRLHIVDEASNIQISSPSSNVDDTRFNMPTTSIREYDHKKLKKWICGNWNRVKDSPHYRRLKTAVMRDGRALDNDYIQRVKSWMCTRFYLPTHFLSTFAVSLYSVDQRLAEFSDDPITEFFAYHNSNFFSGILMIGMAHCFAGKGYHGWHLIAGIVLNAIAQPVFETKTK